MVGGQEKSERGCCVLMCVQSIEVSHGEIEKAPFQPSFNRFMKITAEKRSQFYDLVMENDRDRLGIFGCTYPVRTGTLVYFLSTGALPLTTKLDTLLHLLLVRNEARPKRDWRGTC